MDELKPPALLDQDEELIIQSEKFDIENKMEYPYEAASAGEPRSSFDSRNMLGSEFEDRGIIEQVRKNAKVKTGRKSSKQWDYIRIVDPPIKVGDKVLNLVCAICLANDEVNGAWVSAKNFRPDNLFRVHHYQRHRSIYDKVLSESSHAKNLGVVQFSKKAKSGRGAFVSKSIASLRRKDGDGKEILDRDMSRLIMAHHLPVRFARCSAFRQLLVDVAQLCKHREVWLPCHPSTVLNLAKTERKEIQNSIKAAIDQARKDYYPLPFIFELSDGWKDCHHMRYIGVSVHWIPLSGERKFRPVSALLGVRNFPGAHTAERCSTWILDILKSYGITADMNSLLLYDNAERAIGELMASRSEETSTLACYLHNLSLSVMHSSGKKIYKDKEAKNNFGLSIVTKAIRKAIKHINNSAPNLEKFNNLQIARIAAGEAPFKEGVNTSLRKDNSKHKTKSVLTLVLDSDTRWKSLRDMTKRINTLSPCVIDFFEEEIRQAEAKHTLKGRTTALKKVNETKPSSKHLRIAQQLATLLELPSRITVVLQSESVPTLPIAFPLISYLHRMLKALTVEKKQRLYVTLGDGSKVKVKFDDLENEVQRVAILLRKELEDRYVGILGDLPDHEAAAIILDPRQMGIDLSKQAFESGRKIITQRLVKMLRHESAHAEEESSENNEVQAKLLVSKYASFDIETEDCKDKIEIDKELAFLDDNSNCSDVSIEEDVNFTIEERAEQVLEQYLSQPRLGRSLASTADQRAGLLMDIKSKSLMILKWWEQRYTMDKLLQKAEELLS